MKKASDLVNSELIRSTQIYDKLSDFVYQLMHLNKDKHNLWIVVKQQKLTILTDNPYLATQLKYQQQTICDAINKQFLLELKHSRVKIIPPKVRRETVRKTVFGISDKASSILKGIAADIDDTELKASLLQLTHNKNRQEN